MQEYPEIKKGDFLIIVQVSKQFSMERHLSRLINKLPITRVSVGRDPNYHPMMAYFSAVSNLKYTIVQPVTEQIEGEINDI